MLAVTNGRGLVEGRERPLQPITMLVHLSIGHMNAICDTRALLKLTKYLPRSLRTRTTACLCHQGDGPQKHHCLQGSLPAPAPLPPDGPSRGPLDFRIRRDHGRARGLCNFHALVSNKKTRQMLRSAGDPAELIVDSRSPTNGRSARPIHRLQLPGPRHPSEVRPAREGVTRASNRWALQNPRRRSSSCTMKLSASSYADVGCTPMSAPDRCLAALSAQRRSTGSLASGSPTASCPGDLRSPLQLADLGAGRGTRTPTGLRPADFKL